MKMDIFLTLALDRGEWSASHPGHFTPRERVPSTHWVGGWAGSRTSLEFMANRKIPFIPLLVIKPQSSSR